MEKYDFDFQFLFKQPISGDHSVLDLVPKEPMGLLLRHFYILDIIPVNQPNSVKALKQQLANKNVSIKRHCIAEK